MSLSLSCPYLYVSMPTPHSRPARWRNICIIQTELFGRFKWTGRASNHKSIEYIYGVHTVKFFASRRFVVEVLASGRSKRGGETRKFAA